MKENKMIQKSGDNSNQYQIKKVEINNVFSIEEWKSLLDEENKLAIANSQLVAESIANERLKEYGNVLLPKLVKAELLSCFTDPAIQFLFRETQKTAICSDRECDYEMLSEMLIHKIENKSNRTISASIEKAINEVNNISEDSLMMLTILYAIITYTPNSQNMKRGLNVLDELYGKLLNDFAIPNDFDWLDNLEVTNSIRIGNIGGTKKLDDFFSERLGIYTVKGINKNSENYNKAVEILNKNGLTVDNLVDNELDNNYCKLPLNGEKDIDNAFVDGLINGVQSRIELTTKQKDALKEIYKLYENGNMNLKFKEELMKYPNIKILIEWWNSTMIDISFKITAVGRVLACTNARRIDSTLPQIK